MVTYGNRRPLKILHIDPERNWGGGEIQVMGLLGYLSSRGHCNHLLCDRAGALLRRAREQGITAFAAAMRNEVDLRPVFHLRRLIRREKYDIVHFHTKRAHGLSLWLGRLHPGLRYVVTRRMDYPVRRGWYDRRLYNRRVDGVIAISRKIADILIAGGVEREKIRVIHSGIDPEPFQAARRSGAGSDVPVVGTVAVLEERKGHRFLLEAAARLKRQGHKLAYRFAGEGSERARLEGMAREMDLGEEVFFEGPVSDIPGFLSRIDIFVLPSLHEGLGVAVLEAMAAAKPVVATDAGGLPELIEDLVTGLLVPPRDSPALARSIARLLEERDLAVEMGKKALERVRRDFTVERMAEKNEDFYYDLLRGSS